MIRSLPVKARAWPRRRGLLSGLVPLLAFTVCSEPPVRRPVDTAGQRRTQQRIQELREARRHWLATAPQRFRNVTQGLPPDQLGTILAVNQHGGSLVLDLVVVPPGRAASAFPRKVRVRMGPGSGPVWNADSTALEPDELRAGDLVALWMVQRRPDVHVSIEPPEQEVRAIQRLPGRLPGAETRPPRMTRHGAVDVGELSDGDCVAPSHAA